MFKEGASARCSLKGESPFLDAVRHTPHHTAFASLKASKRLWKGKKASVRKSRNPPKSHFIGGEATRNKETSRVTRREDGHRRRPRCAADLWQWQVVHHAVGIRNIPHASRIRPVKFTKMTRKHIIRHCPYFGPLHNGKHIKT